MQRRKTIPNKGVVGVKFSDFKPCDKCGGSGFKKPSSSLKYDSRNRHFLTERCELCELCQGNGKRTAVEIVPLDVPEGYEFLHIDNHNNAIFFKRQIKPEPYIDFIGRELPYTQGEVRTFVCEVCGGTETPEVPTECLTCYNKPELTAKCTMTVEENKLIVKWEEV